MRYQNGLVVGKFLPFHNGHKLLIEEAAKKCRNLVVLVCSNPDPKKYRSDRRKETINRVFGRVPLGHFNLLGARVTVIGMPEAYAPFDFADDYTQREAIKRYCEINMLIPKPDVVFSSESYGPGFARHMGADHIMIDPNRKKVPVSATQIRTDVYSHFDYLPEETKNFFRYDYIEKVCFLGAESTGKTTLTQALAELYDTKYTVEVGRDFCEGNKWHKYTSSEMAQIVEAQERHEDDLLYSGDCKHYLFCDTCAITTEFYSYEYNEEAHKRVKRACLDVKDRYDYFFLLSRDFPWEDDGTRRLEGDLQRLQQAMIKMQLDHYDIPYVEVGGTLEERTKFVKEYLDLKKQVNYYMPDWATRRKEAGLVTASPG